MAEERSAAGGRTPGPGNHGGGGSPAAASRIRVDISDITKLRQGIKDTQAEAKKLSDTLAKFDSTALPALRKVTDELKQMQAALASSGTRSAVGPKSTTSNGTGTGTSNQHAGRFSGQATVAAGTGGSTYLPSRPSVSTVYGNPYDPGPVRRGYCYLTTPQQPSGTRGPTKPGFATTPLFTGAVAALSGISNVAQIAAGHMPDAVARSYLLNTGTLAGGGPTGFRQQEALNRSLVPAMGNTALNYADATQAYGTLRASGVYTGGYGASRMASVGALSNVNPLQGNATSAQQVGNFFTSQNYYRARLMGVNLSTKNGQNITQSFDQIIRRIDPQNRLSMEDIQSGNQQGSHLYADISWMDPDMRQNFIQYWLNKRAGRGRSGTNNLAHQAAHTSAAKARAQANADAGLMPGYKSTLQGQQHLWNAAGAAADTGVGHLLEDAAGSLSGFTKALNMATHGLELLVASSVLRSVLGKGGLGKGLGAAAGRLGLGGLGGLGAAAGAAAPYVGIAAAGVGAGLATNYALHHNILGSGSAVRAITRYGVEDPLSWMGIGPRSKGPSWSSMTSGHGGLASNPNDPKNPYDPNLPNYVFGESGWINMSEKGHPLHSWREPPSHLSGNQLAIFNQKKSAFAQTGASGQDANLWGGAGTTFPMLEAMAKKGPHEIVTSTTGGKHAQNSYHYKGQAIDLADKAGSHDSPGLLAINRYLAKNYGHKLAELIYAGPGGVNIKNGKVVNGMSVYGAATMAEHHNHVHAAATPASLGMSGGVDVGPGSASSAPSAASSGGFDRPGGGGSGGGLASVLGSIYQTSSMDALLGALSGSFGGGGGSVASPNASGPSSANSAAGRGAAAGRVPTAPTSVSGNVALGKRMAAARGWTGKEWDALYWLWNQESGWRTNAGNSAGAWGIPQALPGSKMASAGRDWRTNPRTQIEWGEEYIAGRYHDPLGAVAHKHATDSRLGSHAPMAQPGGWYASGNFEVLRDELARLHKGEMVVPAVEAAQIRSLVQANRSVGAPSGAAGRRVVPVKLVFEMKSGGEAEARKHAHDFARFVAEDHSIEMVAAD